MDYQLFYWNVPFRGNFPLILMSEAGLKFEVVDASKIYPDSSLSIICPGVAPPYLLDCKENKYLNQMPAIMMHLASRHNLLPKNSPDVWLALKLILDCNDILYEITRYHGMEMWTSQKWKEFRTYRLSKWLNQFETIGYERLDKTSGFFFDGKISVADLSVTALLGALKWSFPALTTDMKASCPNVLSLVERVEKREGIKQFLKKQRKELGKEYCSGQIEDSIRSMLSSQAH